MGTIQKILVTADRLFAQKGYENVSMQDISKHSKVSVISVYDNFKKGKEDIAINLLKNYIYDLQFKFSSIVDQKILDEDIEKILNKIVLILIELGQKYPSSFHLSKIIETKELEELNQKTEEEICSKIAFLLRLKLPSLNNEQAKLKSKMCYWVCDSVLAKWEKTQDKNLITELKSMLLQYLILE